MSELRDHSQACEHERWSYLNNGIWDCGDIECPGGKRATDAEFHRIAEDEGYRKVTQDCPTCGGDKLVACYCDSPTGNHQKPCPDCSDGRRLREGVVRYGGNPRFDVIQFPAEWLEADDARL